MPITNGMLSRALVIGPREEPSLHASAWDLIIRFRAAWLASRRAHKGFKWIDPSLIPARQIDDRFRRI
jgi:hypothetical protein